MKLYRCEHCDNVVDDVALVPECDGECVVLCTECFPKTTQACAACKMSYIKTTCYLLHPEICCFCIDLMSTGGK